MIASQCGVYGQAERREAPGGVSTGFGVCAGLQARRLRPEFGRGHAGRSCIPVTTAAGAIPRCGGCGVLSDSRGSHSIANAIRRALEMPEAARRQARRRILERFPAEKRKEALRNIMLRLCGGDSAT